MKKFGLGLILLVVGVILGRIMPNAYRVGAGQGVTTPQSSPIMAPATTAPSVEAKWIGMFRMGNEVWNETVEMRSDGTFRYYNTKDLDLAGRWSQQGNWPNGQLKLVFKLDRAQTGYNDLAIAYDGRHDQVKVKDQQDKSTDSWWSFSRIDSATASKVAPSPVPTVAPQSTTTILPGPLATPEDKVEIEGGRHISSHLDDYAAARAPSWIGHFAQTSGVGDMGFELRANGIFHFYDNVGSNVYGKWEPKGNLPGGEPVLVLQPDEHFDPRSTYARFEVAYDAKRDVLLVHFSDEFGRERWNFYPRSLRTP
ncbi:MAG: hypothetical protein AAB647_01805 [Patescibacteria group bacterium]